MKGQPSVRLQDVAEVAGVSIATASRSLSRSMGVSDAVAERVRGVAQQMGYVANMHARSLAGGSSRSVGLLVHEIGDPYFTEIASGVLKIAVREGLTVQICHTGRDPQQELDQIRTLIANRVGAIIIAGSGFVDPDPHLMAKGDLQAYRRSGGRVSVIGRHQLGVDAVLPDNESGGHEVARHLLAQGHRRIGVVSGSRSLTTIADRMSGIAQAFADCRLSFARVPVIEASFDRQGGRQAAAELLASFPDVTAILALNDTMAFGVLAALRERGISVPHQMSVTGFDDVAVAADVAPPLTTIRLPMSDMGEQALLMALKEPSARPRRRRAGCELVIRESTDRPRT